MINKKFLVFPIFIISLFFVTLSPLIVDSAGLVPCGLGGDIDNRCTICHLFVLANNIIVKLRNWIFVTAVLIIAIAGVMYIVSVGNESMMSMAKTAIKAALIGAVIILVAWLAIHALMIAMAVKPGELNDGTAGLFIEPGGGGFLQFRFACQ